MVVSRQSSVGSRQFAIWSNAAKKKQQKVLTTENYGLAAEKGGWNGPLGPFPRDEEEGGEDGRLQRKRWSERLVRPQSRGLRAFFGRLAVRRPATLPLWPSIDRVNVAAVRC